VKRRPRILVLFLICFLSLGGELFGQNYELNARIENSYDLIMDFRFEEARSTLVMEALENPENYLRLLMENYIDALVVFLTEDEQELVRYKQNSTVRMDVLEKGDKSSPWYLLCKAEVSLHSAFARMKFQENFHTAKNLRRAYKLLKSNHEQFPDFYPNLKSLGILEALIGTIPDSYRWALNLLGLEGNIQDGMLKLNLFLDQSRVKGDPFYFEAKLLHGFFQLYLLKDEKAAGVALDELEQNDSQLARFIASNLSFRLGDADRAIAIIEEEATTAERQSFEYLSYVLGSFYLYKGEPKAEGLIRKYAYEFGGQHYLKEAHQRLAWVYFMKGDTVAYRQEMKNCINKGEQFLGGDGRAFQDAKLGKIPHVALLKAQLRFDGGYCEEAEEILNGIQLSGITNQSHLQEYQYRKGRVEECLGNYQSALTSYQLAQKFGTNGGDYFAPKAALQMGQIFEDLGELSNARMHFEKALEYDNHPFKSSLDQQAKAGLNRIKTRLKD